MNRVVIPTGYMGSGSSAITDLISEFAGYEAANESFEYIFMHCPGGVFDLEDKLLIGNNALRSDEALHTFYDTMKELYESKLWWPGNYKKKIGKDFLEITQEYIDELIQYKSDSYWYMQEKYTLSIFLKMCIRKLYAILSRGNTYLKKPLNYSPMWISYIDEDSFNKATRKYLEKIFVKLGIKEKNIVLDQLLLPYNLHRMEKYMGENVECFVVDRDPRDVFISNKYVWTKTGNPVAYPTDVHMFCKCYRQLRNMEKKCENPHIHRISFEDLVYHYEESVEHVLESLGIDKTAHVKSGKYFNPKRSINNTQLFLDERFKEEARIIEEELAEYLYEFPYERKPIIKKSF